MEEHKRDPPSREEPGSREDSLGKEPAEPGSNPPPEPDSGSKGPRVRFYDPSQARKETAVKRQLQLGGRESRLSNSAQNDQSGRGCNGRHGYHPSRQPNRHHHTGCRQWPGQRGEEKPPTGQQAKDCTNRQTLPPNQGRNTPPESPENQTNNSEASPTATPAGSNSSRVPGHRHSWTSQW